MPVPVDAFLVMNCDCVLSDTHTLSSCSLAEVLVLQADGRGLPGAAV